MVRILSKGDLKFKFHKRNEYVPYLLMSCFNFMPLLFLAITTHKYGIFGYACFTLFWIFFSTPQLYTDIFLSQYTKRTQLSAWKMAPISIGLCWYNALMSSFYTIVYSIDTVYIIFYFWQCITPDLPWVLCSKERGRYDICVNLTDINSSTFKSCYDDEKRHYRDIIICKENGSLNQYQLSSYQYADYIFLDPEVKRTKWDSSFLVISTTMCWIGICCLILARIYRLKKVVKVNVILFIIPYFILLLLLWLNGPDSMKQHLKHLFNPVYIDFTDYKNIVHIMYDTFRMTVIALRITTPTLWTYSTRLSYQPNSASDAIFLAAMMYFLQFFAALLCWTIAGIARSKIGIKLPITDAILLFLVHVPTVIVFVTETQHFWLTIIYFCLGVTFLIHAAVETTGVINNILAATNLFNYRQYFIWSYTILLAVPPMWFVYFKSGKYNGLLDEAYKCFLGITGIALLNQTITTYWIYGTTRLCDDIHFMSGSEPALFWKLCWNFSPVISILFVISAYINLNFAYKAFYGIFYLALVFFIFGIVFNIVNFNMQGISIWRIFEPTPDWGPPNRVLREQRKKFHPREEMQSQTYITTRVIMKQSLKDKKYK